MGVPGIKLGSCGRGGSALNCGDISPPCLKFKNSVTHGEGNKHQDPMKWEGVDLINYKQMGTFNFSLSQMNYIKRNWVTSLGVSSSWCLLYSHAPSLAYLKCTSAQ